MWGKKLLTMAVEKKYVETPLMKQYYQIKAVHPDAILLFRVGDFYETFGDDAIKASSILGITLTKRANGAASSVELAGFNKNQVSLTVEEGYLTILAENNEESVNDGEKYIRRERSSKSLKRSFFVGDEIVKNEITASMENGILTIVLPKTKPVEPEKTTISIN